MVKNMLSQTKAQTQTSTNSLKSVTTNKPDHTPKLILAIKESVNNPDSKAVSAQLLAASRYAASSSRIFTLPPISTSTSLLNGSAMDDMNKIMKMITIANSLSDENLRKLTIVQLFQSLDYTKQKVLSEMNVSYKKSS